MKFFCWEGDATDFWNSKDFLCTKRVYDNGKANKNTISNFKQNKRPKILNNFSQKNLFWTKTAGCINSKL